MSVIVKLNNCYQYDKWSQTFENENIENGNVSELEKNYLEWHIEAMVKASKQWVYVLLEVTLCDLLSWKTSVWLAAGQLFLAKIQHQVVMLGCLGKELHSDTIFFLSLHQEGTLEVSSQEVENARFFDVALWGLNCGIASFKSLFPSAQESSLNNASFCCGQLHCHLQGHLVFTTSFCRPPQMWPQPFFFYPEVPVKRDPEIHLALALGNVLIYTAN